MEKSSSMYHHVLLYLINVLSKIAVKCTAHCGEEIPAGVFRVDVVEEMMATKKDSGWVKKVFYFA
jgi:hypothetical protein